MLYPIVFNNHRNSYFIFIDVEDVNNLFEKEWHLDIKNLNYNEWSYSCQKVKSYAARLSAPVEDKIHSMLVKAMTDLACARLTYQGS